MLNKQPDPMNVDVFVEGVLKHIESELRHAIFTMLTSPGHTRSFAGQLQSLYGCGVQYQVVVGYPSLIQTRDAAYSPASQ